MNDATKFDLNVGLETPTTPTSRVNPAGKAVATILYVYFLISTFIFIPYYNWQYAKEHGFMEWMFFGEVVPTAKALVWPYFVFLDKGNYVELTAAEKENAKHFSASLHADAAASDILYSKNRNTITKSDIEQVISLRKTALSEAQALSDSLLDKIHPDLRKHFRQEYQPSLVLAVQVLEGLQRNERDPNTFNQANELGTKWTSWYNSDNIRAEFKVPQ